MGDCEAIAERLASSALEQHCLAGRFHRLQFHFPNPFEVHEVGVHEDSRDGFLEGGGGSLQFFLVMFGFGTGIAAECFSQTSIGATIGMTIKITRVVP